MGHVLKPNCPHSSLNLLVFSSTSVSFTLTTVQVPDLALTLTKRITVYPQIFTKIKIIVFFNRPRKKIEPIDKELYFLLKKLSLSSQKYGLGIQDLGSRENRKAPDPGSGSATLDTYMIRKSCHINPLVCKEMRAC
jgi:hypothetical protein